MSYLYAGKILFINLTDRQIRREPTSSFSDHYLGGRGINIRLLYEHMNQGIDPYDPASCLVLGVGPLGGTCVSSGRTAITAKSPESNIMGLSNFGGFFGAEMKYAGYDHILITGKADKPVYIWIDDDRIEIRDASGVWGRDTYETPIIIRQEVGNPEAKVICIGPAGEKLVRFASIQSELGNGAGRTGMGAIFGSKNLKSIAIRGRNELKLAKPDLFLKIATELEQLLRSNPGCQEMSKYGVSRMQDWMVKVIAGEEANESKLSQHAIFKKFKPKRAGCWACPVQCKDYYQVEGIGSGVISCEFYGIFVHEVGCNDPSVSLECALLTQRYGIDCVSLGVIISWLMKLYKEGIISEQDTDGIPMKWGDPDAIRGILEKIVFREGVGDILAEGIVPAANKIGRNSLSFANQVKGIPMVECWNPDTLPAFKGMALSTAIGARGDSMAAQVGAIELEVEIANHQFTGETARQVVESYRRRAQKIAGTEKAALREEYAGKPELVVYFEDISTLCDSLSTCKYLSPWNALPFNTRYQASLFSAGTGTDTTPEVLQAYAGRIRTLERAFDAREGLTRESDTLPREFVDRMIQKGKFKGEILDSVRFEKMKEEYYTLRGWDTYTGVPKQ